MGSINLATEDELSEIVGIKLITHFLPNFEISIKFRRGGFGYLKTKCKDFCNIVTREPLFLITDLDQHACPSALISQWMGNLIRPEKFIFRVAITEIEAWLLADHTGMKSLLVNGANKLPQNPDSLKDPKRFLLKCASKAPRHVKEALLIEHGALASQGLGYNNLLGRFVINTWDPIQASTRSDSLARAINRLSELA